MGELGIDGCDSKVPTEVGKLLTLSGDIWSYVRTQKGAWGGFGGSWDRSWNDPGSAADRSRVDPRSILDGSWIDSESTLGRSWVNNDVTLLKQLSHIV